MSDHGVRVDVYHHPHPQGWLDAPNSLAVRKDGFRQSRHDDQIQPVSPQLPVLARRMSVMDARNVLGALH